MPTPMNMSQQNKKLIDLKSQFNLQRPNKASRKLNRNINL